MRGHGGNPKVASRTDFGVFVEPRSTTDLDNPGHRILPLIGARSYRKSVR